MCTERIFSASQQFLVLAMVATLPAALRQHITNHTAGSVREPLGHSMCQRCVEAQGFNGTSGDLLFSEELEEGPVSSTCLVTWLIEDFSFSTVFLMILDTPR